MMIILDDASMMMKMMHIGVVERDEMHLVMRER